MSVPDLSLDSTSPQGRVTAGRLFFRHLEVQSVLKWVPLVAGMILGLSLAYATFAGAWFYVAAVLFAIPTGILILRYPVGTIYLYLLLAPLFAQTITTGGRYLYWATQRALVPIGLGLVMLSYLAKRRSLQKVRLSLAELVMGVFVALVPVSILIAHLDTRASLIFYFDRILVALGMYLLVRLFTWTELDVRKMIPIAFVMAAGQSLVGLLSWYLPQLVPAQWMNWQGSRSSGTLGDPAVYSSALIFAVAILFHYAMNRKPGLLRTVLIVVFGVGLVSIFLTITRGSWLGATCVVLGLLALYPKQMVRILAVFLLIGGILGLTLFSSQLASAAQRLTVVNTVQTRVEVSQALVRMFSLKPIFGWGYETEGVYSRQFIDDISLVDTIDLASHNTYLTIMAEMGIVGIGLYLFPFAYWFLRSLKLLPRMPKKGFYGRSLLVVLWLIILHHFVVANFMDMRFFPFGLTLWWLTLGLVANLVVAQEASLAEGGSVQVLTAS